MVAGTDFGSARPYRPS